MIDFTPRGIKKGGRVRKFFHEKSMTVEMKGKWGEMRCLKPIEVYNGNIEEKSCWLKIKSGGSSENVRLVQRCARRILGSSSKKAIQF